ncbi:hypothetical protein [Streptomyces sp. GZWMJZ-114]|uniref:hypothetical protein n=1 Tax=Streptomyces sp. GZWMJZ-114 TaxID=2494734 RepID=UPI001010EC6F|nr:hypothetical protein [Streptomyces sp. GZWMJZ-114]
MREALRATYGNINKSSFSRYMHGEHVPGPPFVKALYRLAERHCQPGSLPLPLEELLSMREEAETTTVADEELRQENARLREENARLREQLHTGAGPAAPAPAPAPAPAQDGDEPAATRQNLPSQKNTQANGAPRVAREREPCALPVGRSRGDRQAADIPGPRATQAANAVRVEDHRDVTGRAPAAEFPEPAARQTAARLVRRLLDRTWSETGRTPDAEAALSLLLDVAGSVTPGELSEATRLLHSAGQEVLADSLVTAFARQQEERDVILAALALQRAREDSSLGLLLATAARRQR